MRIAPQHHRARLLAQFAHNLLRASFARSASRRPRFRHSSNAPRFYKQALAHAASLRAASSHQRLLADALSLSNI